MSDALGVLLSATACWYLSGLLAGFAFTLGLFLLRPDPDIELDRKDPLKAFTWIDGRWYREIAVEGYHYDPAARSSVGFFPVYPLLSRGLAAVTGLRAEAALLTVSNLSLLAAVVVLLFYVRQCYPDASAELAHHVILALVLFPTGCFFRLAYSEATCLLLSLLSMYAILRGWPFWTIALIIGLATASRPIGVALLVPFAIHICRCEAPNTHQFAPCDGFPSHGHLARSLRRLAIYLPIACWGLGAFLAYQAHAFGDPLAWTVSQQHCAVRATLRWPEKVAALATLEPLRSVYDESQPAVYWLTWQPHSLPWFSLQFANPILFVSAIVLICFGAKRRWLDLEETALASTMLAIPYLGRAYEMGMNSMGRYVAVVVPLYFVLGQIFIRLPSQLRGLLLSLSGFFLAVYTALYAAHYDIF